MDNISSTGNAQALSFFVLICLQNFEGVLIFGEIVNLSSESLNLANVLCAVKQQENLFVNICNIPSPIAQCCVAAADSNARA